jgi:hypothetical protein
MGGPSKFFKDLDSMVIKYTNPKTIKSFSKTKYDDKLIFPPANCNLPIPKRIYKTWYKPFLNQCLQCSKQGDFDFWY